MYDSPSSLQDVCVDFICEHLIGLCETTVTNNNFDGISNKQIYPADKLPVEKLVFKCKDVYFHPEISEHLLKTLCLKGKLTDFEMSLFDVKTTCLRKVYLPDARKLTVKGLRMLKGHKISELEACCLTVTVNDLIGCLGEWTLHNLRSLNVARSTFTDGSKYCVVVALSKLQALLSLDVSGTEFNKHGLEIVVEDLPQLESLNISSTRVDDISPLKKCKHRLKRLDIYDLKLICREDVLAELSNLRCLDMSEGKEMHPFDMFISLAESRISDLLNNPNVLPYITALDLSGSFSGKDEIARKELRGFIRRHPKLQFLGLVQSDACYDECFTNPSNPEYRPDLQVAGTATEEQILLGLKRYTSRPWFVQKCLYNLFRLTPTFTDARVDIIELVLPGMQQHPQAFGVQMAATACLYNLTKGDLASKIHPRILARVVELSLDAMETFPDHYQLQKNTLLTLCSDRILQEVPIDKYRCAKLVLDSLCAFEETSMNRMSVAICSILAAKIATCETSKLGAEPRYMRKLLELVRNKMDSDNVDITMKFTLSALWNLTDESPTTCGVFLEEGGLELFLQVLQKFPGESTVETKVLGLVNNIAEVPRLRHSLLQPTFISLLRELLHSNHIDVSYFAAGIMAHLASKPKSAWVNSGAERDDVLEELGSVVSSWETPESEMVAYRSFHPFISLLKCTDAPQVQLWAVWAIRHVCTKNAQRYCPMLEAEEGSNMLRAMLNDPNVDLRVRTICQDIIHLLRMNSISGVMMYTRHQHEQHQQQHYNNYGSKLS
ncbi:protein zyg-11 homolog B-like isoform X2 [Lycorma delicatula]|uniref:protein zyg-11 homolog B-like isoform X2 n=1 Tax=Lycorma delicatula TaxID=130591 RepID=UPI003F5177BA